MSFTPDPTQNISVTSTNGATGYFETCGNYALGAEENGSGVPLYLIWNVATRSIVAEHTGNPVWSDPTLPKTTGNAVWVAVDSTGTLWGFDDADTSLGENYQPVVLSKSLGGAVVSHGTFLLAVEEDQNHFRGSAFTTPAGTVFVWDATVYTGAGCIIRYIHNGTITALISGNETGVAMDFTGAFQDPWGDIWCAGTSRFTSPNTSLTFWRIFSGGGASPISGDVHTVSGLPASGLADPGIASFIFTPAGKIVCKWAETIEMTAAETAKLMVIDTTSWTATVHSIPTAVAGYTPTSVSLAGGAMVTPQRYLPYIINTVEPSPTSPYGFLGLIDLVTFEAVQFPNDVSSWGLDVDDSFVLLWDETHMSFVAATPSTSTTVWLAFAASSANNGTIAAAVTVQPQLSASTPSGPTAPVIVQAYLYGKAHARTFATINASFNANFSANIKAVTYDPPPPPLRAIDTIVRNKPKGGRMAKIIDVRRAGGDVTVLGKALVLPSSSTDGPVEPMEGSIRFNPEINKLELYFDTSWHTLEGGAAPALSMSPNRILGRTTTGTGQPQEIVVGEGLLLSSGILSSSLTTASFYPNRGTKRGILGNSAVIPLGLVAMTSTVSATWTCAQALVAATASCRVTIMKQTGSNAPVVVGYFDWVSGGTRANLTLLNPSLTAKDVLWLTGPTIGDSTLAHFAFLVMA